MPSSKSSGRRPTGARRKERVRPGVVSLTELALDLHWAWNHRSDEIWAQLDPELWAATHNPWFVLQTVSRARLDEFLGNAGNSARVEKLLEHRRRHLDEHPWFQTSHPDAALTTAAYFSMEFALSEALPIYSGGLGNVAGDQLKAACDLGVPVVGVGLLYQRGYFRQVIQPDGRQQALYPYNDTRQLPITPVRDVHGDWLRVQLSMTGAPIHLRAWQVRIDRRTLYLLDSNDPANSPAARAITSELYGGGPDLRLQQEIVLGIGGWRLLQALGLSPEVCHLNEGHAAFAVLERARCFASANNSDFETALMATRAGNLFTTHTAVPSGFDRFDAALIDRHLRRYVEDELRVSFQDFLALGRGSDDDSAEPFNMTYLAVRGSGAVNAVSRLHGAVSRRLFTVLFPRWPEREVPIDHVTNGVHVPTWDSSAADSLWTAATGHDRWRKPADVIGRGIELATDSDLWALRSANRHALVQYVRERMPRELAAAGAAPEQVAAARTALDADALTIGFARRFATYKRPTLLLRSPERLLSLLTHPEWPVQLVIAGKAHPADHAGQAMIAEWVRFSSRPEVEGRVLFIPDYDLLLAEHLVQGVDLWLNTPRRPWEASGTSGMKVLVNGGLNLSELDGWWAEAYAADVGWALGDGREHGDDAAWDDAEAELLYRLLEREIVPAFYARVGADPPGAWVTKMRASMATLTPRFSTNRVVREYADRFYLPAAAAYRRRAADSGALASRLVAWRRHLSEHWTKARIGAPRVDTREGRHEFSVHVDVGGLDPEAIRVELFADSPGAEEPLRVPMTRVQHGEESGGAHEYVASVLASRPAGDFTVRLLPYDAEAMIPLEAPHILWQR